MTGKLMVNFVTVHLQKFTVHKIREITGTIKSGSVVFLVVYEQLSDEAHQVLAEVCAMALAKRQIIYVTLTPGMWELFNRACMINREYEKRK